MKCIKSFLLAIFLGIASLPVFAGPVDINTADAQTLARQLDGVGPKTAAAIVSYREKYGAFKSVDDLVKVKGVGSKTLEKNRANMTVGSGAGPVKAADTAKTGEKAK